MNGLAAYSLAAAGALASIPTAAGHLYVVNARFGNTSPTTADYWITRLS